MEEKVMRTNQSNPLGEIEVAPEVLEVIAGIAANEVDGVYAMQGKFTKKMKIAFGKPNHKKGVHLTSDEDGLKVDIYCYFKFGVNVPEVAQAIQKKVREQIFHMTDITLAEVNIHIADIVPEKTSFQDLFDLDREEDEEE
ncbi:PadR family transcriptional regulator, regulatory protein PadR [Alkalibacterium subtropicum]|uniref:PadR family transcriptional regulator, regulatory protein PadR n=2 Tax=Alkalibacterium subtropicum TaxID=753702 RepID=A0A1I1GY56_9LACT|nr:PadR family transcriptional regulator, regulatory protein PadR [Alkalibacterium subtropicum]